MVSPFLEVPDPRTGWIRTAAGEMTFFADGVPVVVANATGLTVTGAVIDTAAKSIALGDADADILAANTGKVHIVGDVAADRTYSLPPPTAGLVFPIMAGLNEADGHDWIFDTGSDTNFFLGGVAFIDTDDAVSMVAPDGDSNSIFQVNVPAPGTLFFLVADGTHWTLAGSVVSATAPAFSDQA